MGVRCTSCSGERTGSALKKIPLSTLKTAAFAPIPSASVTTAIVVNPGLLMSIRPAYRTSCMACSSQGHVQIAWASSSATSVLPNCWRVRRAAPSASKPWRLLSRSSIWRWNSSSSLSSMSKRSRRNKNRSRFRKRDHMAYAPSRMATIVPVRRVNSAVSCANRFRPAAVMR